MHNTDQLPIGSKYTPRGTPLHVSELMLLLVKQAFANLPNTNPYRFCTSFEDTGVHIDMTLNKDSGIYGKKPIIIISRGPVRDQPMALGDMASMHMANAHVHRTGLISSSINFKVLSRAKMECEIVSQTLFNFLKQYRILLPSLIGLHSIESVDLSEVQRFEEDDEMFIGQLNWLYTMQMHWTQDHKTSVLRSIETVLGFRPA